MGTRTRFAASLLMFAMLFSRLLPAQEMLSKTPPDKMDFATWESILSHGSQADQNTVWNAIKGKAVQMEGKVISTTPDQFMIAGSSDDIDANKADITLKFEDKVPPRLIPKDGTDNFVFQGVPASYTSNPFMMGMEKGQLLRTKAAASEGSTQTKAGTEAKPCADSATVEERKAMMARTHCEALSCVQKMLYFSNISQPTDLQDVVNAIRAIADVQRVQQIIGAQIVIVSGTAEQVALAEKLATEIDRAKRRFVELGYRIDLEIQESDGDKKINSRLYSLVTEPHQTARVSIGKGVNVPTQNETAPDTKQPSRSTNSRSIQCRILTETERTLELSLETEFSADTAPEPGASSPLVRNSMNVTVELDKPLVIARIDDPESQHRFTVELTATRIKSRP